MAVPTTMDPGSWLVKHLESEDGDLLREMVKTFAETLMSAEVFSSSVAESLAADGAVLGVEVTLASSKRTASISSQLFGS